MTRLRLGAIGAATLLGMVAIAACSTDSPTPSGASTRMPSTPSSEVPASAPTSERPYVKLSSDDKNGPLHTAQYPAEPDESDVLRAARNAADRAGAEAFAITLNHALESQTGKVATGSWDEYLARDLPADSRAEIKTMARWQGARVVPGSRSWIRSQSVDGSRGLAFRVQLVELIEVPELGDGPGEPYVLWGDNQLTVRLSGDAWVVDDLQRSVASESKKFSPYTWKGTMDSGVGWRRINVQ